MYNKKVLSLILAFIMIFSTVAIVFADTTEKIGADAKTLGVIEVLKGDTAEGVTIEYLKKETTRMQAATMYLRLIGKENEALAFKGTSNFTDADTIAWAGGKAIMAYLKANPELGWIGSETGAFSPTEKITTQQYYKVMLESLGYKQNIDFKWIDVIAFAATKGLDNLDVGVSFTNNDLAIATVEALMAKVKGTNMTLSEQLVDAAVIEKKAAVEAGLYPKSVSVAAAIVDEAVALGNTVVEVTFEDDIDAAAENYSNYSIKGLEVSSAVVTGSDTVRLITKAQKAGTLYELTFGKKSVSFAGIAAVSGGPFIKDSSSEDIEEVVITFDRNVDYETAINVTNYTIKGIEIKKAEVSDGNKVTLTTEGLENNTSYDIKAEGIKSVDGVLRNSSSDSFRSDFDEAAPRIDSTKSEAETNQRVILYFTEKVAEESAENILNYALKINETDGAELEILSVTWNEEDENNVEIITEAMDKGESYRLTVNNITDQRKAANTMARDASWTFMGIGEDDDAPEFTSATVISKDKLIVVFEDDSRINEDSVSDTDNYTFTKGTETLDVNDVMTLKNEIGIFKALVTVDYMETGKNYELEVNGILDEFGNAISEAPIAVRPKIADFASAALVKVMVNSKSEITLSFNKELNESSSENIANYSIDGGIGTPIEAVLNDDGMTVELEVNELTNGKSYSLTVDGVKDLAGNVLEFTKEDIVAEAATDWDTDAPKLDDVYAENMYVTALQFDEEVKFAADTELWLTGGSYTAPSPLKLTVKTLGENNKIVEFSLFDGTEWVALDENVNYTVFKVVAAAGTGISDLAGNKFVMPDENFTFDGSDDIPEYPEVDSYDQIDESTFELIMTENVKFKDTEDMAVEEANVNGLRITIDKNVLTFIGHITEGEEYIFDLREFLTDEHGMAVVNEEVDDSPTVNRTVLVGKETDEKIPYINVVKAINNITVEVEFNENIAVAEEAFFEIRNISMDKNLTIDVLNIEGKIVTLVLSSPLEGRYEYELTMEGSKVKDFAGNSAIKDTVYFSGSDLAPMK